MLLVDEVDRLEIETEALLLEVLSDYQVSIPELGTIRATQIPLVFLTSNNTRELSEALKRRCLFLHLDYPSLERERAIVLAKVPGVTEELADQVARIVRSLRSLELEEAPLHLRDPRLGAHARALRASSRSTPPATRRQLARPAQVPLGHRRARPRSSPSRPASERARRPPVVLDVLVGFVAELRRAGPARLGLRRGRRGRGDRPHPPRGPPGDQVRPGRDPGEVRQPLARLRHRLRGLLLGPREPSPVPPSRRCSPASEGEVRPPAETTRTASQGPGQSRLAPEEIEAMLLKALSRRRRARF